VRFEEPTSHSTAPSYFVLPTSYFLLDVLSGASWALAPELVEGAEGLNGPIVSDPDI